ncbi:MAG: Coiled-coil protein 90-like [Acidimicrobiaceae bacterium]|jgi:predicted nuclease with TOPRIM domain
MRTQGELRELFAAAEGSWGRNSAEILMQVVRAEGWDDVARRADLEAFRTELRGEMVLLRGDMTELRAELRGELAEMRGEMTELRAELRGEVAEMRGEMTELRAELRGEMAELRGRFDGLVARQLVANVPLAFGVAGLVLAAAKLA